MSATVETVYRTCPTCEASCGLVLEVDREAKQVLSIKGDPRDVRSRGYVCAKSQAFRYIYEDPQRLRRPVQKTAQGWQEISWQRALDEVATRLIEVRDQYGKDAIAMYYGNPNGHNFHTQIYTQLFITMLNTERFFSAGSVDQQPQNLVSELLFGNAWLFPVADLDRCDFLVCMGANPAVSQGSILGAPDVKNRIAAISKRGGKTVVIDPRRTETADTSDQHIFIRPGTDALFLFAWVNELFATDAVKLGHLQPFTDGVNQVRELAQAFSPDVVAAITGIKAATTRQLVREFCNAKAPVLYSRIGLCTQEFGTLASWLVCVINILCGRLDVPGGSMFARPATGQNEATGTVNETGIGRFKSRARGFPEYMNMLPASLMAEELECAGDDAVHAMITVAGNPVLSVPNGQRVGAAMDKLDFVVALDFYINETTSRADIILPSTTQLEHSNYELLFSAFAQSNFARYSPVVFEPEAGSKHQYQLFLEIIARINGMASEDLNTMMLDGLIAEVISSQSELDAQTIKKQSSDYKDGERLLDILLRAGPYGDKFDAEAQGLKLDTVKAAEHGVDLGSLQPQLPQILRTKGQRLQLLHDIISADIPRLQGVLQRPIAPLVMIGRRHIRDMNSWLHNIEHYVRGKNRCTVMLNPVDANRLGLVHGGQALVRARVGQQQLEVCVSDEIMPGVVSIPHGFGHRYADTGQSIASDRMPGVSANDLVDDEVLDLPSGTSVVNGVPVTISATQG